MSQIILYLVILFVPILALLLKYCYQKSMKIRTLKMGRRSDEIANEIKSHGAVEFYSNLSSSQLIKVYRDFKERIAALHYNKDIMELAEIGCREKLIADILTERGVRIPESK